MVPIARQIYSYFSYIIFILLLFLIVTNPLYHALAGWLLLIDIYLIVILMISVVIGIILSDFKVRAGIVELDEKMLWSLVRVTIVTVCVIVYNFDEISSYFVKE